MKNFLIRITTLFIFIFLQLFFQTFRVYAEAENVCKNSPIIEASSIFVENKKPIQEYKIYFSIIENPPLDVEASYVGYSWVVTGTCPACGYETPLTGPLKILTQEDINSRDKLGANLKKDLSEYNYVAKFLPDIRLDETSGLNSIYYEFNLRSKDNVNLKLINGIPFFDKCNGNFEVVSEPPDFEPVSCLASSIPESNKSQGYYNCFWDAISSNWENNNQCSSGFVPHSACNTTNKNLFYFDTEFANSSISVNEGFCSVCESQKTSNTKETVSYNEECELETEATKDNCDENLICKKSLSQGKNVCIKRSASLNEECIIGENECIRENDFDQLFCLDRDRSIKISFGKIGSKGICLKEDELEYVSCVDDKPCMVELERIYERYGSSDPGYSMKGLGYVDAICDPTSKKCAFAKSSEEAGQMSKQKQQNLYPEISPVIPAPPSRFIEKCKEDLSCANCVARKLKEESAEKSEPLSASDYEPFKTYADAAAIEYTYNEEVDKWKKGQLESGDYKKAPTPTGFTYTGYIYTSLGCIDTTDNGLITRVVQIALGVIGSVILVRFAQAALKLQGGSSPEDKAEGIEIVTSAIVALLLFVMSMIVLRFIGVDLFQIFSPGSFEIG